MTAAPRPPQKRNDPVLLVEACLALLLLALFIALYVFPTQTGATRIAWWTPVVLGGFALGLLLLDSWRRKRRHRREMQEMMEEHLGESP